MFEFIAGAAALVCALWCLNDVRKSGGNILEYAILSLALLACASLLYNNFDEVRGAKPTAPAAVEQSK